MTNLQKQFIQDNKNTVELYDHEIDGEIDLNNVKRIKKEQEDYKDDPKKNIFQNLYTDIMLDHSYLEHKGAMLYFYFEFLAYFFWIFLILSVLALPSIIINLTGGALTNRTNVMWAIQTSIANRGFDVAHSTQFFNFQAKLRKKNIRDGLLNNYRIYKDNQGQSQTQQRLLQTEDKQLVEDIIPENFEDSEEEEKFWQQKDYSYWHSSWNEDFLKELVDAYVTISGNAMELTDRYFAWNSKGSVNFNGEILPDSDLKQFTEQINQVNSENQGLTSSGFQFQKLGQETNNNNSQNLTISEIRLEVYTKLLGEQEDAQRWLNDSWLLDTISYEKLQKYLEPGQLNTAELEEKEITVSATPGLKQYLRENEYPQFKSEEDMKEHQIKKRISQVKSILHIQSLTQNEIIDSHVLEVKNFLGRFNQALNNVESDKENSNLDVYYYALMSLECLSAILLLLSIFYFQLKIDNKMEEFEYTQKSVKYYSLRFEGFPVQGVKLRELEQFFDQFGQVQAIHFIRDFEDALFNAMSVEKTILKIKEIQKHPDLFSKEKIIKILNQYQKIRRDNKIKMAKINADKSVYDAFGVMVVFNKIEQPTRIIKAFEKAYGGNFFNRIFYSCFPKKIDDRFLFRKKYKLTVQKQDHPENILWQNMEFRTRDRIWAFLKILYPLLIIVILSIIICVGSFMYTDAENPPVCTKDMPRSGVSEFKNYIANNILKESTAVDCFCNSKAIFFNKFEKINFYRVMSEGEREICQEKLDEFWQDLFKSEIVQAIVIAIINIYMQWKIYQVKNDMRFMSETDIEIFAMDLTSFMEFLNTIILTNLIFIQFGGFSVLKMLGFMNDWMIKNDDFEEFEPIDNLGFDWYLNIGQNLIAPLVIQQLKPFFFELMGVFGAIFVKAKGKTLLRIFQKPYNYLYRKTSILYRYWFGQLTKSQYDILSKLSVNIYANGDPVEDLGDIITEKSDFQLGAKYEAILAVFLIILPFSGVFPLLYITVTASLLITYILHKYSILHVNVCETFYSMSMINNLLWVFKIILFIKIIFDLLLFPRAEIFPKDQLISTIYKPEPLYGLKMLEKQIMRGLPLAVCFLLMIVLVFFEGISKTILRKIFKFYWARKNKNKPKIKTFTYSEVITAYREQAKEGKASSRPMTYNIYEHPKYVRIVDFDVEKIRPLKIDSVLQNDKEFVPVGYQPIATTQQAKNDVDSRLKEFQRKIQQDVDDGTFDDDYPSYARKSKQYKLNFLKKKEQRMKKSRVGNLYQSKEERKMFENVPKNRKLKKRIYEDEQGNFIIDQIKAQNEGRQNLEKEKRLEKKRIQEEQRKVDEQLRREKAEAELKLEQQRKEQAEKEKQANEKHKKEMEALKAKGGHFENNKEKTEHELKIQKLTLDEEHRKEKSKMQIQFNTKLIEDINNTKNKLRKEFNEEIQKVRKSKDEAIDKALELQKDLMLLKTQLQEARLKEEKARKEKQVSEQKQEDMEDELEEQKEQTKKVVKQLTKQLSKQGSVLMDGKIVKKNKVRPKKRKNTLKQSAKKQLVEIKEGEDNQENKELKDGEKDSKNKIGKQNSQNKIGKLGSLKKLSNQKSGKKVIKKQESKNLVDKRKDQEQIDKKDNQDQGNNKDNQVKVDQKDKEDKVDQKDTNNLIDKKGNNDQVDKQNNDQSQEFKIDDEFDKKSESEEEVALQQA